MLRNIALLAALAVIASGCASQPADTAAAEKAKANASLPVVYQGAPPGWTPKKRKGELVYCKKVEVTGSLFPKETCYYAEDLDVVLRNQKESAQRTLDIPRTSGETQ
jgi:hypothetical protein